RCTLFPSTTLFRSTGNGLLPGCSQTAFDVGINRTTAVVVQRIKTELSVVQGRYEPAERHAELTTVTCVLILASTNNVPRLPRRRCSQIWMTGRQVVSTRSR